MNRLKELRLKRKLSQNALASVLGINQNNISRYETHERKVDYLTLIKLADFFNVSIDYLLGRTNNPEINL